LSEIKQYKCPQCNGGIEFSAGAQRMKCPYCDTEFDVAVLENYAAQLDSQKEDSASWSDFGGSEWQEGEEGRLSVFTCEACSGQLIADENTAATACPFCGNPTVIPSRLSGSLRPDYVIPFRLDKKAAKEALKRHLQGKRLLPRSFREENRIEEIRGIYVPFWLYDADTDADILYRAESEDRWEDDDYVYTKTEYYSVRRAGNMAFDRVPVDGSAKIDNTLMESIEPYDFSDAVDFNTAYLSGFLADKYDVDSQMCAPRAEERIRQSTADAFRSTVTGYDSVRTVSSAIVLENASAKYALYPVWLLNTNWEGKRYTFAMNGQTGKMVGDLPLDRWAYWSWFLGICAAVTAGSFALWTLISLL